MEKIRDQLADWLRDHRADCRDGHCPEPFNALAYLAHCLGVRVAQIGRIQDYLAKYEAKCPECQHLRN